MRHTEPADQPNAVNAVSQPGERLAALMRQGPRPLGHYSLPFALLAASLIGAVILIMTTISAERDERAQVQKTNLVLLELRNVGRAAINAETAQRGYFITLDRRYLAPYNIGRQQYRPALDRLNGLLGDRATRRQATLLSEIEELSTAKFAEIDDSIRTIRRGEIVAAQNQLLSDEGQEVMERLRRAINEMETIEQGVLGRAAARSAAAEARIVPMLVFLLVMLLVALGLGYWQSSRAARAEAAEAHAIELAEARDRADLLARELNHRVKNLFAVILAIVRLSARNAPEAKETTEKIAQRIQALSIAHDVTQGAASHTTGDLAALIETTLAPHRTDERTCTLGGPPVTLPIAKITPLGLVLHELATNAVKYGAWSQDGSIAISWQVLADDGRSIAIEWREHCPDGCAPGDRKGFGSTLMESSARQLQGSIDRKFVADGCCVSIAFPSGAEAPAQAGDLAHSLQAP